MLVYISPWCFTFVYITAVVYYMLVYISYDILHISLHWTVVHYIFVYIMLHYLLYRISVHTETF